MEGLVIEGKPKGSNPDQYANPGYSLQNRGRCAVHTVAVHARDILK